MYFCVQINARSLSHAVPASLLLDLLRGFLTLALDLEEFFLALTKHHCRVVHTEPLGHLVHAALLLVASVDLSVWFELGDEVGLLAQLTNLDVRLGVVTEEQVLILRIRIDPVFERRVLQ